MFFIKINTFPHGLMVLIAINPIAKIIYFLNNDKFSHNFFVIFSIYVIFALQYVSLTNYKPK